MGYYFTSGATRAAIIEEIVREWGEQHLAHKAIGNNLWLLIEGKHPDTRAPWKYIALALLEADRAGWGYKPLDETMGPSEVNCPLEYLRAVAEYQPMAYARKWRERAYAYHGIAQGEAA